MDNILFSPYIVPLGAFLVAIVAIAGGIWGQAHARRVKAEQRMAMLARGIPLAIGVGFWIDYNLQKREMSRFGLEVGEDRG